MEAGFRPGRCDAVAAWGRRPVARRALWAARRFGLPLLNVEDAFLRSVRPGRAGGGALGLLIDPQALHYDASRPSELERMLEEDDLAGGGLAQRAAAGIAYLRAEGLSKYCDWDPDARPPEAGYVLVVDQTAGDAAIAHAGASAATFAAMLAAARAEHPDRRIVLRTHPVTASGRRGGHFGPADLGARTEICAAPVNPWDLLAGAAAVYCVSSQLGFEAILAGHRPVVFGQPFYAGWGLSDDRQPIPRRTRRLTPEALFAGAMLRYPVWYDPFRDRLTDFETAAQILAAEARAWRENRRPKVCAGMKPWKHKPLSAFLHGAAGAPVFSEPDAAVGRARREGRDLLVWAGKETPALRDAAAAAGVSLVRVEDGFLRSVGLGARLLPAASLVFDDLGIYFDPTHPSRLERLIAATDLTAAQRGRADALAARLVAARVTKYNVGAPPPRLPVPPGRRLVLVPGQVEDDASIRLGAGAVRTNRDLLAWARARFPDDVVVYKPHPDVEAGLREGAFDADALADHVAREASSADLMDQADVIVTMTSLMGFEGLLRGCEVHCLGMPFYAGWGLTSDHGPVCARRTARPDLPTLVHSALIAYPRYFDPVLGRACPPEVILDRLAARAPELGRNPALRHRLLARVQDRFSPVAGLWRR